MSLLLLAGLVLVVYAATVTWAYQRQRKLQYAPTFKDSQGKGNSVFQSWKGAGGEFLGYIRASERPRRAVVFFHGNGGEALDRAWISELVPTRDVLILAEYPGYGARPGSPSQETLLRTAEELVDQVRAQFGTLPVTAVGESLGSAVAGFLASKGKVDRVAFISPFSSMYDVARRHFPFLPVRWILRDGFELIDYAKSSNAPLRIVHGTLDDLVPIEQGREVYQAYNAADKQFTEIPGFGHNNLDSAILHSPFANRFRQFLEG